MSVGFKSIKTASKKKMDAIPSRELMMQFFSITKPNSIFSRNFFLKPEEHHISILICRYQNITNGHGHDLSALRVPVTSVLLTPMFLYN